MKLARGQSHISKWQLVLTPGSRMIDGPTKFLCSPIWFNECKSYDQATQEKTYVWELFTWKNQSKSTLAPFEHMRRRVELLGVKSGFPRSRCRVVVSDVLACVHMYMMYVCVYMYVCVLTYVHVSTCMCICTCIRMHVYKCVYVCVCLHTQKKNVMKNRYSRI